MASADQFPSVVPRQGLGLSRAERRIASSLLYMREHLSQPLRVSTLSMMVDLSPSHFFTLFKQVTGDTPINFLIRERMRRACELLRQGGLSVKEVAAELGYQDPYYFSRLFKAVNHVAPSHYRAAYAEPHLARKAGRTPQNC